MDRHEQCSPSFIRACYRSEPFALIGITYMSFVPVYLSTHTHTHTHINVYIRTYVGSYILIRSRTHARNVVTHKLAQNLILIISASSLRDDDSPRPKAIRNRGISRERNRTLEERERNNGGIRKFGTILSYTKDWPDQRTQKREIAFFKRKLYLETLNFFHFISRPRETEKEIAASAGSVRFGTTSDLAPLV